VFDESLRGLAEGHYPWDLESKPNMMPTPNISKVERWRTACSCLTTKRRTDDHHPNERDGCRL